MELMLNKIKQPYKRGGGRNCAVVGCSNNQRKLAVWRSSECEIHAGENHGRCPCLEPFKLYFFPKQVERRSKWILALNRKGYNPGMSAVVCSDHFVDGRPTESNPVPALALGFDNKDVGSRGSFRKLRQGCILAPKPGAFDYRRYQGRILPKYGNRQGGGNERVETVTSSSQNNAHSLMDQRAYEMEYSSSDRMESISFPQSQISMGEDEDWIFEQTQLSQQSLSKQQAEGTFDGSSHTDYGQQDELVTSAIVQSLTNRQADYNFQRNQHLHGGNKTGTMFSENMSFFSRPDNKVKANIRSCSGQRQYFEKSPSLNKNENRKLQILSGNKRQRKLLCRPQPTGSSTTIDSTSVPILSLDEIKVEPNMDWVEDDADCSYYGTPRPTVNQENQPPSIIQSDTFNQNVQQESEVQSDVTTTPNINMNTTAHKIVSSGSGTIVVNLENVDIPDAYPSQNQKLMKEMQMEDDLIKNRQCDRLLEDATKGQVNQQANYHHGGVTPVRLSRAVPTGRQNLNSPCENFGTISDVDLDETSFTVSSKCSCCDEMVQVKVTEFKKLLKLFIRPEFLDDAELI